ncbi:hypothetical protein ANN_17339 [Periplaneta americana]|uniref:Odorant receptor n=1 Tax=Periplaneta americana TaxID=6978 RepID=A0ABQ8SSR8_PERAM|nr:hypothetical protein ANN_17339 [Periplaneta americana]
MYDTLYPFDTSVRPVHEFIFMTQVIAMLRISLLFIGTPYFYVTIVCIACTQLQKVKHLLLQMKQKIPEPEKEMADSNELKEALRFQQSLNNIVRLHQQIISYVDTLEEFTCLLLGGVFFLVLLLQCTTAYAVANTSLDNINAFARAVYLYLLVTWVGCVYCGFGNLLSQEYESVGNAAFASDWVGTPVSYQKCISFMIAISNKGFNLTAAKFVPVSNSTLMNVNDKRVHVFIHVLADNERQG